MLILPLRKTDTRRPGQRSSQLWLALLVVSSVTPVLGQQSAPKAPKRKSALKPTHENVRYGPHQRNVLDLYLADSSEPTPLVLYIHGGGFRGGDKTRLNHRSAASYLKSGISVAALNYRLTDTAPMPAAYLDCARALQFLRFHAKKWNLDPRLVASTGGSAGAGISLWIAFHDDLADPNSDDPVARESTRLVCVATKNGQSSYDPRFAAAIGLPRPNFERHKFFLAFYGIEADEIDSPKGYQLYDEAAPVTYLSKDDPPVLMQYTYPDAKVDSTSRLSLVVHHPRFGIALKERMDTLGIECIVEYPLTDGAPVARHGDRAPTVPAVRFIRRHLEAAKAELSARARKSK